MSWTLGLSASNNTKAFSHRQWEFAVSCSALPLLGYLSLLWLCHHTCPSLSFVIFLLPLSCPFDIQHLPRGMQAPHVNASWWDNSGGKGGGGMDIQMSEIRDYCWLWGNDSEHFLLINNCATSTKISWGETSPSIFLCRGYTQLEHWDLPALHFWKKKLRPPRSKMTANRLQKCLEMLNLVCPGVSDV